MDQTRDNLLLRLHLSATYNNQVESTNITNCCNNNNRDSSTNNNSIDLNEVIGVNGRTQGGNSANNEKKKVARRRWGILAKALKSPVGSEPSSPTDEISVRRISSFMLLQTQQLPTAPLNNTDKNRPPDQQIAKRTWYKYSIQIDGQEQEEHHVVMGHRNRTFSAEDLMGFNNTGNVCIWPSEETLSYYVCKHLRMFADKRVLELGGGMSCLAGLFAAKFGNAATVLLTDGNRASIENVQAALRCNDLDCRVDCRVLKWGGDATDGDKYHVVLCADCLFFDEARSDLIECLASCLTDDGIALVMAPQRGVTLDRFIAQSEVRGLACVKRVNYDDVVWARRAGLLLNNCDFDDNLHYPILIEVTKQVTLDV